jgi:hypothetical protein
MFALHPTSWTIIVATQGLQSLIQTSSDTNTLSLYLGEIQNVDAVGVYLKDVVHRRVHLVQEEVLIVAPTQV